MGILGFLMASDTYATVEREEANRHTNELQLASS